MQKLGLLFVTCLMAICQPADGSGERSDAARLNLGVGLGRYMVSGDDFEEAEDGTGIRSYVGIGVGGETSVDLNLGFHFSRHGANTPDYHINSYSVYAEPRVLFLRQSRRISPFVGARLGWARAQGVSETTEYAISGDGFALGGMGGISFPLVSAIRAEVTVSMTHLSFKPEYFIRGFGDRVDGKTIGFQFGIFYPISIDLD